MKASFYGHFVAGEDVARIRPLVQRNMSFGVKSILDYSVEKDISREEARAAELAYVILVAIFVYNSFSFDDQTDHLYVFITFE